MIAPWEVWWSNFDPQVGREPTRPAVVVGSMFACELPNDLAIVVPCTTSDRQLPFHPRLHSLGRPTFAMCDQLKSISRQRLLKRDPATLTDAEISELRFVLRRMLDV